MGNCFSFDQKNDGRFSKIVKLFKPLELKLIEMIFKDISSNIFIQDRSEIQLIDIENFLRVFKFSGLFGLRLYNNFVISHQKQYIDFVSFVQENFVSCDEDQQIKQMFSLYDLQNKGTLNQHDLRTMFYNYSKESIKRILNDTEFVTDAKIFESENIKDVLKKDAFQESEKLEIPQEITQGSQINQTKYLRRISHFTEPLQVNNSLTQEENDFSKKNSIYMDGQLRYLESKAMGTEINFTIKNTNLCVKQLNLNYLVKKYIKFLFEKLAIREYF